MRKKKKRSNRINIIKRRKKNSMVAAIIFLIGIIFFCIFIIYQFNIFDYNKIKDKYKKIEMVPENIIFLGDSLTEFYDLKKYYPNRNVVNSGVGGNLTKDILDDMENRVYRYNPSHVILLIGINDLNYNPDPDDISNNIKKIVKNIEKNLPKTKIYLESLYPINYEKLVHSTPNPMNYKNNKNIKIINKNLKKFSKKEKIVYINVYDKLTDKNGNLKLDYTKDGLHLSDKGYEIVTYQVEKTMKEYY